MIMPKAVSKRKKSVSTLSQKIQRNKVEFGYIISMPQMPDGEGFVSGGCKHTHLFFGSGGFLVLCTSCSTIWKASSPDFIRTDLNEDDLRIDPRVEDNPKSQLEDSPSSGYNSSKEKQMQHQKFTVELPQDLVDGIDRFGEEMTRQTGKTFTKEELIAILTVKGYEGVSTELKFNN